ncbi:MAG: DUF2867 domain-containing protein [Planctomycetes bacterium]|nr:DUF2867 domain-containing protein [Planctomycetota bacterium]
MRQTASATSCGLGGLAYWYAVLPFHALVFRGMLEGLRREAEQRAGASAPSSSPAKRLPA